MKFKIIGDSCCDLTKEQLNKEYFFSIPLTLNVGGIDIIDDETFEQANFLQMVSDTPECPKSSCPSPDAYMQVFDDAEDIYIVTLSAKLSGSYNSAVLARQIYMEDHPDVNIHVFDSKSAAAGEHVVCLKIEELAQKGVPFMELVKEVEKYIEEMKTVFVLEDLDIMRKNGRLSKVKAVVANMLNIKPVLIGVDGEIQQFEQARSMNKALNKLIWYIEKTGFDPRRKVIITQCESRERCLNVKKILMEKLGFSDVTIVDAGGLSTMYMNRGGVIVSF